MTEINYSFSVADQPSETVGPEEVYSFYGIRAISGPEDTIVLFNPRNNQRMIARPEVAEALRHCSTFRSLKQHAHHLATVFKPLKDRSDVARETLEAVVGAGLFESASSTWTRLSQTPADNNAGVGTRLFIVTCDRPRALNRLLESSKAHDLPAEVEDMWVIDDSRSSSACSQNASIVSEHRSSFGCPIYHFDLPMRQRLIKHLKSSVPDIDEAIDFLLERECWAGRPTFGLARNLSLLLSVGKRALVVDDDVILQAIEPPRATQGLRFGTPNERQALFFDSEADLRQHQLATDASPLTLMLQGLGRSLSTLLSHSGEGPDSLLGCNGESLARYSEDSRALLAQCGSWGHPGTVGNEWIRYLPPASLERLLQDARALPEMLSAQQLWFGYRGITLTDSGTMSQITGIQHTELMPPYLPAGRGEDILFSTMIQRLHPDSLTWNAGWAIRHEPIDQRPNNGALVPLKDATAFALLAEWLGREPIDQWGLTPERRLTGVAEEMYRLSLMADNELNTLISQQQISALSNRLTDLTQRLNAAIKMESSQNVEIWRSFLTHSRKQLLERLQLSEDAPAVRLVEKTGLKELKQLRAQGEQFAEVLRAWPEICEAAKSFAI